MPIETDDIIADAQRLLEVVRTFQARTETPLAFGDALIADVEEALDAARKEWVEAVEARVETVHLGHVQMAGDRVGGEAGVAELLRERGGRPGESVMHVDAAVHRRVGRRHEREVRR